MQFGALGLVIAFVVSFTPPLLSQTGSLYGRVLDNDSKPVADASVYALPVENMRRRHSTKSDAQGNFVLNGLPLGDVFMHAYKESEGYPDILVGFFNTTERSFGQKVSVAASMNRVVEVFVGLKTAYLKLEVTDLDGSPLEAHLEFTRDDQPGATLQAIRSPETVKVPPMPFRLKIEVDGYEPWHYGGRNGQGPAGLITLKPLETSELRVQLRRSR